MIYATRKDWQALLTCLVAAPRRRVALHPKPGMLALMRVTLEEESSGDSGQRQQESKDKSSGWEIGRAHV